MRTFFLFILLIAVIFSVGLSVLSNTPSYVLLSFNTTTIEMNLWVALVLIVLGLLMVFLLTYLLRMIFSVKKRLGRYQVNRKRLKNQEGLLAFQSGEWSQAKKLLSKNDNNAESLPNLLMLAKTNQALQDTKNAHHYLEKAKKLSTKVTLPKHKKQSMQLIEAELLLDNNEPTRALAQLLSFEKPLQLKQSSQRLFLKAYQAIEDWSGLFGLYSSVIKNKALSVHSLDDLYQKAAHTWLSQIEENGDFSEMEKAWHQLPKILQQDADILAYYTRALIQNKDEEKAEKLLTAALNQQLADALLQNYARLTQHVDQRMNQAKVWLQQYPEHPELLLCLGKIAMQEQDLTQAQAYLEKSLENQPQASTQLLLGYLASKNNNNEDSLRYLEQATAML